MLLTAKGTAADDKGVEHPYSANIKLSDVELYNFARRGLKVYCNEPIRAKVTVTDESGVESKVTPSAEVIRERIAKVNGKEFASPSAFCEVVGKQRT